MSHQRHQFLISFTCRFTRRIQDLKGNYLLLFANEWSIRWAEEHNPELKLAEFGRW